MTTQSPLPQNDPLLIAFQQLTHTPEYRNAVNWTIKAENESQADGELWFAFAAGWNAREALAATPADPVRSDKTDLTFAERAEKFRTERNQAWQEFCEDSKAAGYTIEDNLANRTLFLSGYESGKSAKPDPVREAAPALLAKISKLLQDDLQKAKSMGVDLTEFYDPLSPPIYEPEFTALKTALEAK